MKLNKYFMALFALSALTVGCSENDDFGSEKGNEDGVTTNYIAINIANQQSRAASFTNGLPAESAIQKIRFYFFDANGNQANVKSLGNGNYVNYVEWENPTVNDAGTNTNVSHTTAAKLIIQTPTGDNLPSQVMAVVNPKDALLSNASLSYMDDVMRKNVDKIADGYFPMTNSVYWAYGERHIATSCVGYFSDTESGAMTNPLNIYVERAVAKVAVFDVSPAPAAEGVVSDLIEIKEKIKEGEEQETSDKSTLGVPLYLDLQAWNLTTTADKSYIVKHINGAWSPTLLGSEPWNGATETYRSYWAYNNNTDAHTVGFEYKTYAQIEAGVKSFSNATADANANKMYCEENASHHESGALPVIGKRTQIAVAGRITDKAGTVLPIVELMGQRFIADDYTATADGVVTIADDAKGKYGYFWNMLLGSDMITRLSLGESALTRANLTLVTGQKLPAYVGVTAKKYAVYLQLDPSVTGTLSYKAGDEENEEEMTVAEVNAMLAAHYGAISFWKDGQTYYYADIQHIGSDTNGNPNYGVVRNHYYTMNIQGVQGLGTPVYDPTEEVVPETPESVETYLAAKINVLAWRIVSWNVTLGQ